METIVSVDEEIDGLVREVEAAKTKLTEARRKRPLEAVQEYELLTSAGDAVKLSELFGDKEDLILVHNLGTGCPYCTLWADGFTGFVPHLSNRAAFVLFSPDNPEVQTEFAKKRNWNFKMVSGKGSSFNKDMGFEQDGSPWPGVSTFKKAPDGSISRVGKAVFGPGDDFCAAWPFLDLLEGGSKGWEPKYFY